MCSTGSACSDLGQKRFWAKEKTAISTSISNEHHHQHRNQASAATAQPQQSSINKNSTIKHQGSGVRDQQWAHISNSSSSHSTGPLTKAACLGLTSQTNGERPKAGARGGCARKGERRKGMKALLAVLLVVSVLLLLRGNVVGGVGILGVGVARRSLKYNP